MFDLVFCLIESNVVDLYHSCVLIWITGQILIELKVAENFGAFFREMTTIFSGFWPLLYRSKLRNDPRPLHVTENKIFLKFGSPL